MTDNKEAKDYCSVLKGEVFPVEAINASKDYAAPKADEKKISIAAQILGKAV